MVGEGDMGAGQSRIAVDTGVSNWRLVIGKIFFPFGEGVPFSSVIKHKIHTLYLKMLLAALEASKRHGLHLERYSPHPLKRVV